MKRVINIILFVTIMIGITGTNAQALVTNTTLTPSPTQTQTVVSQTLDNQIKQFKDKVASRVAQLNLVEKRAIIGVVNDASNNQITMTDVQGTTRYVDVDEITKFNSAGVKNFGFSDLTKGTKITVLGTFNKDSGRILARFITIATIPVFVTGEVSNIDKINYYLTITSEDQKQTKLNIDATTKINAYTSDQGIVRYGFSKASAGDRVFAIGYPDKKDATLLDVTRVVFFINLPKDPKIMISLPANPLLQPQVQNNFYH